jgi:MFS family permease
MTTLPLGTETLDDRRYWFQHMNRNCWYVLILCALGWMFDCADQMIFTISRSITMRDLLPAATQQHQNLMGGWATTLFMIGWATGGLLFGIVGDRWGRAKTMALTVFLYATFTGLSALSQTWWQFAGSRFLTGFGVGGEFAAGAALVADVMPQKARVQALALLQALSAVGNILGALMLKVVAMSLKGNPRIVHWEWRYLYIIGAVPALLAVFVMSRMREPEKWVQAKKAAVDSGANDFGRMGDLFAVPRWRYHVVIGLALAIAGVIGLWGISFYSPELIDATFPQMTVETGRVVESVVRAPDDSARAYMVSGIQAAADKVVPKGDKAADDIKARATEQKRAYANLLSRTAPHGEELPAELSMVHLNPARLASMSTLLQKRISEEEGASLKSYGSMVQQIGAFFGMLSFGFLAMRIGRRRTFVVSFILAWASIYIVFLGFSHPGQVWYLYPLLGFCTLLPFGGYAVYFPELFPTRLRSTGTGFCYNVGRYVASVGPLTAGSLGAVFAGRFETAGFRVASVVVASVYLLGIIAALCGPETKGQPLPEDQRAAPH